MILTLHISKIEPGNYRVLVLDGREEVDQWEAPNIAAAKTPMSTHTCGSVNAITFPLSCGTLRNARHPRRYDGPRVAICGILLT